MRGEADSGSDPIIVEKASDALRTCYNMQLASALSFKPVSMSLTHLRQGMAVGREVTTKLAASYESQQKAKAADGEQNTTTLLL